MQPVSPFWAVVGRSSSSLENRKATSFFRRRCSRGCKGSTDTPGVATVLKATDHSDVSERNVLPVVLNADGFYEGSGNGRSETGEQSGPKILQESSFPTIQKYR